jgi:hypothetical protein
MRRVMGSNTGNDFLFFRTQTFLLKIFVQVYNKGLDSNVKKKYM